MLLQALSEANTQLKRPLVWFKNPLFGAKSEKRVIDNPDQLLLTGWVGEAAPPLPAPAKQKITFERGKGKKKRDEDCVTDSGLRFSADVPVKTISLPVSPSATSGSITVNRWLISCLPGLTNSVGDRSPAVRYRKPLLTCKTVNLRCVYSWRTLGCR